MDLEGVWRSLKARADSPLAATGLRLPPLLRELSDHLLRAAPVITRKDDLGTLFELHPQPDLAGPRNWCWIMPVRDYCASFPADLVEAGDNPDHIRSLWHITYGTLIDLVAITPDCARIVGRFTGAAGAIGYPQSPDMQDETRLRLCRDMRSWIKGGMRGVVLLGDQAEQIAFLDAWREGIVCDDLAHGKAIDKLLKRSYAGPPVLVAA